MRNEEDANHAFLIWEMRMPNMNMQYIDRFVYEGDDENVVDVPALLDIEECIKQLSAFNTVQYIPSEVRFNLDHFAYFSQTVSNGVEKV